MQKPISFIDTAQDEIAELVAAFLPGKDARHWSRKQSLRFEKWLKGQGLSSLLQMETIIAKRWLFYFIAQRLWLYYRRKHVWMFWRVQQQRNLFNKKVEERLTSIILKQHISNLIYRAHAT